MNQEIEQFLRKEKFRLETEKLRLESICTQPSKPSSKEKDDGNVLNGKLASNHIAHAVNTDFSCHKNQHADVNQSSELEIVKSCPAADLLSQIENDSSKCRPPRSVSARENNFSSRCNKKKLELWPHTSRSEPSSASYIDTTDVPKFIKERANAEKMNEMSPRTFMDKTSMEEWISDTFYSYFPSFNILDKKRQNLAKDRQQEYQEYLKRVSEDKNVKRNPIKSNKVAPCPDLYEDVNRLTDAKHAAETEENQKEKPDNRASTKSMLLQDLKHTALSTIVNGDGVIDRNKAIAENERKKKQEYQKQLLLQIEEKRREMEELKRKEKEEEELLERKLEEQLKTMQLEDELEKERLKAEKVRLNIEQSHAMRMKLLKKLNNDEKRIGKQSAWTSKEINKSPTTNNKVYKYFSNSCRGSDYNKYTHESFFEISDSESDSLHQDDSSLFGAKVLSPNKNPADGSPLMHKSILEMGKYRNVSSTCGNCRSPINASPKKKAKTHCRFCHKRKNICVDCVQNACSNCGDVTYTALTTRSLPLQTGRNSQASSNKSFKILDISYDASDEDIDHENLRVSKSHNKINEPPSNLESSFQTLKPEDKIINPKLNLIKGKGSGENKDSGVDIYVVGQNTNDRLSKYLKNYGDLSPSFSSNKKNNEVKQFNKSPSMPLLREPSKKTLTKISEASNALQQTEKIKKLSEKWEIPVVQKNIVSSSSGVLTQLGAFQKQLQIDKLALNTNKK